MMWGALGRGYADGTPVDPPEDDDATSVPALSADEPTSTPMTGGALATARPSIRALDETGSALIGDPSQIQGAFARASQTRSGVAREQKAAIERAMNVLRASGQDHYNLPALAYGAGMLRPSLGSFGSSLGNAAAEMGPVIERQRADALERARLLGGLDIQQAGVGEKLTQEDEADMLRRLQLGEQFRAAAAQRETSAAIADQVYQGRIGAAGISADARTAAAQISADARRYTADTYAAGRLSVAQLNQMKNQSEYLGPKADEPGMGYYHNKLTGQIAVGPGPANKVSGAMPSAQIQMMDRLLQTGVAKDPSMAWAMMRARPQDPAAFQRLVQGYMTRIQNSPQGFSMSPAEVESMAREMAVDESAQGTPANFGTQSLGHLPNSPLRRDLVPAPIAPAAAPAPVTPSAAAPPAQAAPTPASAPAPAAPPQADNPPIPMNLMGKRNLKWNGKLRQYKDFDTGIVYDERGRPVSPQRSTAAPAPAPAAAPAGG